MVLRLGILNYGNVDQRMMAVGTKKKKKKEPKVIIGVSFGQPCHKKPQPQTDHKLLWQWSGLVIPDSLRSKRNEPKSGLCFSIKPDEGGWK